MKPELNSPCCDKAKLKLITYKGKKIIGINIYEGVFYSYECDNCKERYTTTEQDEYTLKLFKLKKLKLKKL